ncbi:MAG TPA: MmcQ/YjbR family DNA-binding protein [Cellvibrionaceae bacterium]|nr:MmcQ/YjbR family DNA-binding protein [Cellvibrionaceae bacterium]HMW73492.1 MmcQ/YjbR family DNA-binding protein [Cellvibrionaceae bacterium]HMY39773.1 MmcQ/YjbR family DNA-binding protein [Marinagarivorans sp.]HNG61423.1 MmcQ/YjbR family DNA-binding protein [Cellvibrionaceae bacterium]
MKYSEVIPYILSFDQVTRRTISESGTAIVFCLQERIFAYFETGAPIQWKLSLEVSEAQLRELIYPPQITHAKDKPAGHWITIARVENCDEELLKELIAGSYARAQAKNATPVGV